MTKQKEKTEFWNYLYQAFIKSYDEAKAQHLADWYSGEIYNG